MAILGILKALAGGIAKGARGMVSRRSITGNRAELQPTVTRTGATRSVAKQQSDQLRNIRRRFEREAKSFEKQAAKAQPKEAEYLMQAAERSRQQASQYYAKTIEEKGRERGLSREQAIDEAILKGTEQSFRAYSPERLVKAVQAQGQPQSLIDRYAEIARRERLAEQVLGDGNRAGNFYAATKKLWQGLSPQARNAAIVKKLDTPKVREYLGMSPDEPFTILDALRYVEQKRSDFTGKKTEDELKESAGEGNGAGGSDPTLVVAGQLAVATA